MCDSGSKNRENKTKQNYDKCFRRDYYLGYFCFDRQSRGHSTIKLKSVLISRPLRLRGQDLCIWTEKKIWNKKYFINHGGSGHRGQVLFFLRVIFCVFRRCSAVVAFLLAIISNHQFPSTYIFDFTFLHFL